MLNENFVFVGIALNAIGVTSYFIDTIKGNIQPNKVSFSLWLLPPLIAFLAQIKQGVGIQSIMTISVGIFPMIILLASFLNKKAYWKISKFDLGCGAFSLLGLLFWQITQVGNIAIFFSILADALAYIPTLTKSWSYPETESAWPWLAVSMNGLFALLTLKTFNFSNSSFSIYFFAVNFLTFAIIYFKLGKHNTKRNLRKI